MPRWLSWRLLDEEPPADATEEELTLARIAFDDVRKPAWEKHGATILADWIRSRPGTRPSCWWDYSSPRLTKPPPGFGTWILEEAIQPRLRVGGRGDLLGSGAVTYHWRGIPLGSWRTGSFDPSDPPKYEASAAYLKRHGLLLRGEAQRLTAADYRPIVLPRHLWPADAIEPASSG